MGAIIDKLFSKPDIGIDVTRMILHATPFQKYITSSTVNLYILSSGICQWCES